MAIKKCNYKFSILLVSIIIIFMGLLAFSPWTTQEQELVKIERIEQYKGFSTNNKISIRLNDNTESKLYSFTSNNYKEMKNQKLNGYGKILTIKNKYLPMFKYKQLIIYTN